METVGLDRVVEVSGENLVYEVPAGAKFLWFNTNSREIRFELGATVGAVVDEEYQYNDGEKWVRVTPKKTPGPFKNIPEK